MYLILFTTIYFVITQILNLESTLVLGIYVIGAGIIKGIFSKELNDVFNIRKTSYIYEKVGFTNSLTELISLLLIFANYLLTDYEPLSIFEFIFAVLIYIIVYRFLFWNIPITLKKFSIESSHKKQEKFKNTFKLVAHH